MYEIGDGAETTGGAREGFTIRTGRTGREEGASSDLKIAARTRRLKSSSSGDKRRPAARANSMAAYNWKPEISKSGDGPVDGSGRSSPRPSSSVVARIVRRSKANFPVEA
ncbi:MAG TPA: hypothetical protein VGO47_07235 [Chlamydiales bacterium]|nr:hypothetical protein [Chlamydiales bacterium]